MVDFSRDTDRTDDHSAFYNDDVDYRIRASDGFAALVVACIFGSVWWLIILGIVQIWEWFCG